VTRKGLVLELQNAEGLQSQHPDGHGSVERRNVDGLAPAERQNDAFVTRRGRHFVDGYRFPGTLLKWADNVAMALRRQVK